MSSKEFNLFVKGIELKKFTEDGKKVHIPADVITAVQREQFADLEIEVRRTRYYDKNNVQIDRKVSVVYDYEKAQASLTQDALREAEMREVKRKNRELAAQSEALAQRATRDESDFQALLLAANKLVPREAPAFVRELSKDHYAGTPLLQLSDLHFEETVNPKEVRGYNSYNIEIASNRLKRVIHSSADLLLNHSNNTSYDRFVMLLNGDLVSGEIHDELTRTNSASLPETIMKLSQDLFLHVCTLAKEFPEVVIIVTPGNHGRMDEKWNAKGACERSWDMMVGMMLKALIQSSQLKNVTIHLATSASAAFKIHGYNCMVEHGNAIKTTGDAIAGFITSAVRRKLKLHQQESLNGRAMGDPTRGVDYLFIGHFHSAEVFRGVIANGSLIGTNEYAMQGAFNPESPKQVLVSIHPEYGMNQHWFVQAEKNVPLAGDKFNFIG